MTSAVQTESCLVTTEIQSGSMLMVSTVPAPTDEKLSLPTWLGKITTKRRKVVPPDNLPLKKTKFKLKGGKGTKSSQVPEPIQESVTESEEELETESEKEDSNEEGEIRITTPPNPT